MKFTFKSKTALQGPPIERVRPLRQQDQADGNDQAGLHRSLVGTARTDIEASSRASVVMKNATTETVVSCTNGKQEDILRHRGGGVLICNFFRIILNINYLKIATF